MNPFNDALDWTLQGKLVRVHNSDGEWYQGWCEKVHHQRGSIILHDCKRAESLEDLKGSKDSFERVGSVFIRTVDTATVIKPKKRIEYMDPSYCHPYPDHPMDFEVDDHILRRCYRNQFAGSYPVVNHDGTIINGHKRIEAAKKAGLTYHPVEKIHVTDEQAEELYYLAHREQEREDEVDTCMECQGTGHVGPNDGYDFSGECPECDGEGYIEDEE